MNRLDELCESGGCVSLSAVGPHDFDIMHTHNWGLYGGEALSVHQCKKCGQGLFHHYHQTPNIYQALREQGVDLDICGTEKYIYPEGSQ